MKTQLAILTYLYLVQFTLYFLFDVNIFVAIFIALSSMTIILYFDSEYYFLPTNYRKRMKELDAQIKETENNEI